MGQLVDSRDRRRIIGDYILTTEDILTQRTFPDTISHHKSNFDAGALPDAEMFLVKDMKGPVYTCNMPYRCLTPKGLEGLLVTGLGASVHRDAMTLTRMQSDLQNQGYAAGMAAAVAAATTGGMVRDIDIKALQSDLVAAGCLEARVLADQDSFPMREQAVSNAVQTLHNLTIDVHMSRDYDDTLPALAVVMGNPETSIPLLQDAYRNSVDPEKKMNFARVLAVMGDGTGKQTLIDAVEAESAWGQGWDFSSQREKANSFGPMDRKVIALGFTRSPEVHAPLLSKLQALASSSPLSHYKAVCLALRLNKDPSLAEPLADLLDKPGVKGHVQPLKYYDASGAGHPLPRHRVNSSGGDQLNAKFKEVLVAALLYECGDDDGQGQEILEAYTKDVNGHFAAYAHLVLTNVADTRPTNLTAVDISPSEVQVSWQDNASNETGFVIERCTGPAVSAEDLIIDNSEAVFTGSWPSSSRNTGFHGSDYQHDANTDKGSKTADYTPSITQNAVYEVYVRYTAHSSRASNVPITVFHAGGSYLHTVDQRTGGGQWNLLGSCALEPGISHVEIGTGGTDGYVIADAFRFVCSGAAWEQAGTVGPDVTTFVDPGLTQGVMYTYRVKASLPSGDSGYSNEASATPGPLHAFRQQYGLALDGSEDMGDMSGNGLANIVYFLFGLGDPNVFDVSALTLGPPPAAGLPVLNVQTDGTITYGYVRHKTQTDYAYLVRTSSNLVEAAWGDVNLPAAPYRPVSNSSENLDQYYEFCHLFFPIEDGARFIKIQIQAVP